MSTSKSIDDDELTLLGVSFRMEQLPTAPFLSLMPKWSRQHPISIRQKKSRSLLYFAVARWRCWKMSRLRTSIREKNNRGLLWRHSYRTKGLFLSKWDCSSSCIFLRISYLMFALQKIHWSRSKRIN